VFNGADYLASALASVQSQTCEAVETIVVDDGSVDATAEVAAAFDDPRLRYVRQARGGAAAARNYGARLAQGRLIAFLDCDDLWLPTKLERQIEALENGQGEMIFGRIQEFVSPELSAEVAAGLIPHDEEMVGPSATTMLLRRDDFERVGGFDPEIRIGEFIDWFARAEDLGLRPYVVPDVLVRRRLHAANQGRHNHDRRAEYARVMKGVLDRRRVGPGPS
jgi:glycosyltransferase involved in cell wall biosynthesis